MKATELGPQHVGYPVELHCKTGIAKIIGANLVSYADVAGDPEQGTEDGRVLVLDMGILGPQDATSRYLTVYDRDIEKVEVA